MTYYEIAKLRERALGQNPDVNPDTSRDAELERFGVQADSQIDDQLFIVANRNSRLAALPTLPLPEPPQSIKDAATDLAVALFLKKERQVELAESYKKDAMDAVKGYILGIDSVSDVYGVVLD